MYQVDEKDKVVKLGDLPPCDIGAPLPAVVAAEHQLDLLYIASETDPNSDWDGSYVNVVGHSSSVEPIVCVKFIGPYVHMFGPPSEDTISDHPLASRGLDAFAAWEVLESSWIRTLEKMDSVHTNHNPCRYDDFRHFILTFHDTTFECVAFEYKFDVVSGSISSVASDKTKAWT